MAEGEKRVRVLMVPFITAWESSETIAEVAKKTGLKESSVQARASKYRSAEFNAEGVVIRKAIPLKQMARGGGAKLQADNALELLATLRGKSAEDIAAESVKLAEKKAVRTAKRTAAAAAAAAEGDAEDSEPETPEAE